MNSPIFLLGAHKSGTSLIRSLFDGHPDLYVVPFEMHFFKHLGFPLTYEYFKQDSQPIVNYQQSIISHINHINKAKDKYADSINIERFDLNLFSKEIDKLSPGKYKTKELIEIYINAVFKADKKVESTPEKRITEKSVTHHEHAIELSKYFPDAKFIHIVRNPYSNWVALRKYKSYNNTGGPLLYRIANTLTHNYYYLERNKNIIENYLVVKYEDILSNPTDTIDTICSFLDLEFNDSLLTPTKDGKLWTGNSSSNIRFTGINSDNINNWKNHIKGVDIYYINILFKDILDRYKYQYIPYRNGFFKPLPNEKISKYLLNRLYRLYLKN